MYKYQTHLSLGKVCASPKQWERIPACVTPGTNAAPCLPQALIHIPHHSHSHCSLITFGPWPHYLTLPYSKLHKPLTYLQSWKNPNHFECVCFVPLPLKIPQPCFMSSAYFRHFWNYILLEVNALILIPTPPALRCFNSLLIYLYCLLSEPNSINKSWNSNTCTRLNYAYKHSSGERRQLLWSRSFL